MCRPGELCCDCTGNQGVCFDVIGTCPYGLHSKKASMPDARLMMPVRSVIEQVSVTDLPECFRISAVGADEGLIEYFIEKTGCDRGTGILNVR